MAVTSYTRRPQRQRQEAARQASSREFTDQGGDFHPVATAADLRRRLCACCAARSTGSDPDPEQKIRDALEEIDDFTEAVTKMKARPFSPDNHESLGRDSGFLAIWRNGKAGPRTVTQAPASAPDAG